MRQRDYDVTNTKRAIGNRRWALIWPFSKRSSDFEPSNRMSPSAHFCCRSRSVATALVPHYNLGVAPFAQLDVTTGSVSILAPIVTVTAPIVVAAIVVTTFAESVPRQGPAQRSN